MSNFVHLMSMIVCVYQYNVMAGLDVDISVINFLFVWEKTKQELNQIDMTFLLVEKRNDYNENW